MNVTASGKWMIATIVFAICVVTFVFPDMVLHPRSNIVSLGSDAAKNIFTYMYHALYGHGIWFSGMNYPYGEHFGFIDGLPLFSFPLSTYGHATMEQSLTIMWYTLAGSYVLAIVYTYKVLLRFNVRPLIAMLFAGLIGACSPQAYRAGGHFGLSYACIVPMLFFWTVQYHSTRSWKYAVYAALLGLCATFLHPYFCALVFVWIALYAVACFVFMRTGFKAVAKHVLPMLSGAIVMLGLFGAFMKLTDPVKDRPLAPYGMLEYITRWKDVITSAYSPFWKFMRDNIHHVNLFEGTEGYSYPGLVVIGVAALSILMLLAGRKKKTNEGVPATFRNTDQRTWLFIAIGSLIFSMGIPFIWNMEWLVDYLSFFRQFRTLGRFAWIFYYVITVYGVVVIDQLYSTLHSSGRRMMASGFVALALMVWSTEAWGYVRSLHAAFEHCEENYHIVKGTGDRSWSKFLESKEYSSASFQAILVLRFFETGTDKLWLGRNVILHSISGTLAAGMQLRLPTIDAMMARSSWSQIQKQVKIAAGPYVYKPMLDELPNEKPFLLLNLDYDKLDPDQEYLLQASDYIGDFHGWHVYACYPGRIRANDRKNRGSIRALLPYLQTGDTCIHTTGTWYVNHFDSGKERATLFGAGAVAEIKQEATEIANIPVKATKDNELYEFSCWFRLGKTDSRSPYVTLQLMDSAGNQLTSVDVLTKESTDNEGLWFRSFLFFNIPANCSKIKCILYDGDKRSYEIMDEMMLRPADALIISKATDGKVMVNNHLFGDKP